VLKPYKVINDMWVELTDGPYEGIVYKYGRVNLIEEGDYLRVQFEYERLDKQPNTHEFTQHIGPILTELIEEGVLKNSIVYTGGTDAD
jgi:hypothetical protein